LYFEEKLFLNLQFSLQHAIWEKMNRMDGWMDGWMAAWLLLHILQGNFI